VRRSRQGDAGLGVGFDLAQGIGVTGEAGFDVLEVLAGIFNVVHDRTLKQDACQPKHAGNEAPHRENDPVRSALTF
jgi:hypothetical protein